MKNIREKWLKPSSEQTDNSRFVFLQRGYAALLQLNLKKELLLLGVVVPFLLLIAIISSLHHQTLAVSHYAQNQNTVNSALNAKLGDMAVQLEQLTTSEQQSGDYQVALNKITADLVAVQQTLNSTAKTGDVKHVSNQITALNTDVDSQFQNVQREIANGQNAKNYLDPKVLPFHVISIDVISQQPFVSIDYAHHITPLEVGDVIADWQVTSADYSAGQVEFKNDKDQYVKVMVGG